MADFEKALLKILRHEGVSFLPDGRPDPARTGYVNHPKDPGGETNYGITRAVATENGYSGLMRDIPFGTVKQIYRMRYWDKLLGDIIADQDVAEEMFDTAVNCGPEVVVCFIQRTLNVLNKNETLYADVSADGVCGQQTVGTLNKALKATSAHKLCILRAIDSLQCVRYIELAEHKKKFETFMPGWLFNRVGVKD